MAEQIHSEDNIARLSKKYYGLKVYNVAPVRKAFKLSTDQGVMFAKISNIAYGRFLFVQQAQEHVRKQGFINVPQTILTKKGEPGVKTKEGIWEITRWIDSVEASYANAENLRMMAETLAVFHLSTRDFHPASRGKVRENWGEWVKILRKHCEDIKEFTQYAALNGGRSEIDKIMLKYAPYFYKVGQRAIKRLEDSEYYKESKRAKKLNTFSHFDIAAHNMLITEKDGMYIIDFVNCALDMTVHDLVSLIIKSARENQWNIDVVNNILKHYQSVNQVSEKEIQIMKAFMLFPDEVWKLGCRYYFRDQVACGPIITQRLQRVVGEISDRENFLSKFGR